MLQWTRTHDVTSSIETLCFSENMFVTGRTVAAAFSMAQVGLMDL